MAQQGNIVDFNEARAASSVRRARSYADDWAESMAASDRRRARAASRASSASANSSSASSSRLSWSEPEFEATFESPYSAARQRNRRANDFATSSGNRSNRYSSQSIGGFDSMSTPSSRTNDAVPHWLADAYADLDDAKAQSSPAIGGAPAPARSASTRSYRDEDTFAFDTPAFDSETSSRRRTRATAANRPRGGNSSPTTWHDDEGFESTPRSAVFDEDALREEGETGDSGRGILGKLKSFRKNAVEDKAERQFERQFGGETRASSAEAGPRAAVYRGEMGQQQRYAQRLQQEASAERGHSTSPRRANRRDSEESDDRAPRAKRRNFTGLKIGLAVFALIICAGAFMYPTVQSYYQTIREYDRLEAERDAILARNEALQNSINDLSSDAGIAAYAHDQYGWIMPGEQTATVQGLELEPRDNLESINASIPSGSIEAPETWYSPFLDKFFGVK